MLEGLATRIMTIAALPLVFTETALTTRVPTAARVTLDTREKIARLT